MLKRTMYVSYELIYSIGIIEMSTSSKKFTEEKLAIFERRLQDIFNYMAEASQSEKTLVAFEMFVVNTLCTNYFSMNINFMSQATDLWTSYDTNIFFANVDSTIRTIIMMLLNPPNKEIKLYYHKTNGSCHSKVDADLPPHEYMNVLRQMPNDMYFFDTDINASINKLLYSMSSMDRTEIHEALHDVLHKHSKCFATKSKNSKIFDMEVVDKMFVNVAPVIRQDIIFLLWKIVLQIHQGGSGAGPSAGDVNDTSHIIPNLANMYCIKLTKSTMKERINALFYAYYFVIDQQGYIETRNVWNERLYVKGVDIVKPTLMALKEKIDAKNPHPPQQYDVIAQQTAFNGTEDLHLEGSHQNREDYYQQHHQQQQHQQQQHHQQQQQQHRAKQQHTHTELRKKKKNSKVDVLDKESSRKLMYLFTAPPLQSAVP